MTNLNNELHLFGCFPELLKNDHILAWLEINRLKNWKFDRLNEITTVIIESRYERFFLAIKLSDDSITAKPIQIEEVDLLQLGVQKFEEIAQLHSLKGNKSFKKFSIQSIEPFIEWSDNDFKFKWVSEILVSNDEILILDNGLDSIKKINFKGLNKGLTRSSNDSLDSNELHHISYFKAEARKIISHLPQNSTVKDKAFEVFKYVRSKMRYRSDIKGIVEFTWSDYLIKHQLNYSGICDEWAVLQITLLRALNIPSFMRYISFKEKRGSRRLTVHACVEWYDGNKWRHMDALYYRFDDKKIYRNRYGYYDIRVMNATNPDDTLSQGYSFGLVDITGDQKLHTYDDYVLNPKYPGSTNWEYS